MTGARHVMDMLRALALAASLTGAAKAQPMVLGSAGMPRAMADYDHAFGQMADHNLRLFFPTFQYQELPQPRSSGAEQDFLPPCTRDDPGFRAMRKHGVRLIVPADLIYPAQKALPPPDADPLLALIRCAGREGVFALSAPDEPALNGVEEARIAALAAHLRRVAPGLPLIMVHAPLLADHRDFATPAQRKEYLQRVLRLSRHADIVGFDIYPIPPDQMPILSPQSDAPEGFPQIVEDYLRWQGDNMPQTRKLLVMQGFGFSDLAAPGLLPAPERALFAAPTPAQIAGMLDLARRHGVELGLWWGVSALRDEGSPPWPAILDAAKGAAIRD